MTPALRAPDEVLLSVQDLHKQFGALAAVDGVTFEVHSGETLGITGPNGAGKTTLFDVISGHARASGGRVLFLGHEIQRKPAYEVRQRGLARTYQVTPAFASQTVFGNILTAAYFGRRRRSPTGLSFDATSVQLAREAADAVGLTDQLDRPSRELSMFDRKRVMLAGAMASQPLLLMLDEPVSGLSEEEGREVMRLIDSVKESGISIMLIEHVMKVLMALSDRVLVLDQGRVLCQGTPDEVQCDPEVIKVYLGSTQEDGSAQEVANA